MRRHLARLLAFVFVAFALVPLERSQVRAAGKPLVVIVGLTSPLKDIDSGLLRRAFQGELVEPSSGKRLIPINHPPGTPARVQFDLALLGLKANEVGRFWVDRRIRDQAGPPKTVPSAELALRVVMSLPGAITYVTPELLNEKVRVLTIDGKAVGQPGYLLAQ